MALNIHVYRCANPPNIPPTELGQHWVDTSNSLTYISVGTSSIDDWVLVNSGESVFSGTVPADTEIDIDATELADFCVIKYLCCFFNETEDVYRSFELLGSKRTGSIVDYNFTQIVGANINFKTMFDAVGTEGQLIIDNKESFDLEYRIRKVQL